MRCVADQREAQGDRRGETQIRQREAGRRRNADKRTQCISAGLGHPKALDVFCTLSIAWGAWLLLTACQQVTLILTVSPGMVMTPMLARFLAGPVGEADEAALAQLRDQLGRMAPLGRLGEPEDIAHAVLYLASDASSFLTGQILRPNGGVSMP